MSRAVSLRASSRALSPRAISRLGALALAALAASAWAESAKGPDIHIIYMGGNDCPPCVAWRATELPKLRQSALFNSVRFSYVQKTVRSTVPAAAFLPAEVKPLKERLDQANGGNGGSSQTAVVVDGVVVDYYFGSRTAAEIEQMIRALRDPAVKYPWAACRQRGRRWACTDPAS